MKKLVLLLLVCHLGFAAQKAPPQPKKQRKSAPPQVKQPPPAQTAWPLSSITVEGNRIYTPEQVLAAAGLKTGQMAGAQELEAARERLLRTGAFGSAGFNFEPAADGRGIRAAFQIAEVEQVYPFRFEDLGVEDAALRAWLKGKDPLYGDKVAGTGARLAHYTAWIQEYLGTKKISGTVAGRLTTDKPGQIIALFRPSTPPPSVAFVRFQGNQVIGATELANTIAGVAVGLPYAEPRFRHLLQTSIVPLYETRGRVRVTFPKLTVERSKEVDGVVVTVEVNEGEPYELGDVTLSGVASGEDLLKAGKFRTGERANFEEVEAGVERIRQRLRANGYLRVETKLERKIDDPKKTVDLHVAVTPGPQYTFGALRIQGLDLNSEPVIRKRWTLKPGQPYRDGYPDHFLNRVREEGVFDNLGKTKADVKVDDQTRVVDVTLYFAGEPPKPKRPRFP